MVSGFTLVSKTLVFQTACINGVPGYVRGSTAAFCGGHADMYKSLWDKKLRHLLHKVKGTVASRPST